MNHARTAFQKTAVSAGPDPDHYRGTVVVSGLDLGITDVVRVARRGATVRLTEDPVVHARMEASREFVARAVRDGTAVYGVTTGFGGMSNIVVPAAQAIELQNSLIWCLKAGAGRRLPRQDVRATMLLRASVLARGLSGVRVELVERLILFLNEGVTPVVGDLGSIGASGDLVPLAAIAGALTGKARGYLVDFKGEDMDCISALQMLGLPPLELQPKEGLALVNGTSAMSGIAANCVYDARVLLALTLGAHALLIAGLGASVQAFHPFIHEHKPFPGQIWVAAQMLELGTAAAGEDGGFAKDHRNGSQLIQDRYSVRCLPQYLGPVADGIAQIGRQIEIEMNSVTDNPLIDVEAQTVHYGGNFLGEYVGVGMDQLRNYLGLMAKHLDVQIASVVSPEFNNGLPASLAGDPECTTNAGLKGLQLCGNSIMPQLCFLGNSFVDRFPTHAEQYNQNINSLGFGAANLARQSIELFTQYVAIAVMFGVQAADLRARQCAGHHDGRVLLDPRRASCMKRSGKWWDNRARRGDPTFTTPTSRRWTRTSR